MDGRARANLTAGRSKMNRECFSLEDEVKEVSRYGVA
jgi:hypothetical protein